MKKFLNDYQSLLKEVDKCLNQQELLFNGQLYRNARSNIRILPLMMPIIWEPFYQCGHFLLLDEYLKRMVQHKQYNNVDEKIVYARLYQSLQSSVRELHTIAIFIREGGIVAKSFKS